MRGSSAVMRVLDGVPVGGDLLLAQSHLLEGGAAGEAQLCGHDVDPGDLLGDGVLHLDPGVHLDEHVATGSVEEELHRPGVRVPDGAGKGDRVVQQRSAYGVVEVSGRRRLDDLLEASLDRAVALEEVDGVTGAVAEDLHLDVAHVRQRLLQEDRVIAEGRLGLAPCRIEGAGEVLGVFDASHAPPAPAGDRLDEEGVADLGCPVGHLRRGRERRRLAQHRRADSVRCGSCPDLRTGQFKHLRCRADEGERRLLAGLGPGGRSRRGNP